MSPPGFLPLATYREFPAQEMASRAKSFCDEMLRRRTVRQFSSRAVPTIVAAWWVPTAKRLRGDLFLQLHASQEQAHGLAQGVLTGHFGTHAAVNAVHTIAGTIMTWGIPLHGRGLPRRQ